ncbi:MAG: hypothetical protein BGO39_26330 [Chloroflexi bacterium 54-19]|nr:MAG: hypothetical protein BGO39_26330 [Chloroflexi bacterium 54-19]
MLDSFLDYHRATLLWKVRGVGDEDLRRSSVPTSTMTLLGLVKHLAYVERSWFQHRFKNDNVTFPWTKEDPDADWRIEPDETTEGILRLYDEECEKSRQIVAAASLDEKAARSWPDGNSPTLRWIMYHMIEETARHNGHADLLREAVDGATGE